MIWVNTQTCQDMLSATSLRLEDSICLGIADAVLCAQLRVTLQNGYRSRLQKKD